MPEPMLQTIDLVKSFAVRRGFFAQESIRLMAVDHVNISIDEGETFGLVGESGCGKSTLGLTVMQLYTPNGGQVRFDGQDLVGLSPEDLRHNRRRMQMIFQDPYASLDPRMSIEQILLEPLNIHGIGTHEERLAEVRRLLDLVGLPTDAADRFPSEFSGGQQQRIGIARALALQPKLIICDEPVSALDVSVQASILNLLRDLQDRMELTYLFISHNIAVTGFMSKRIGVMYLGRMMEIGSSDTIINHPSHPYTQALISAVPEPDPKMRGKERTLTGDVPSPIDRPSGCPFHPRCPLAKRLDNPARCREERPELRELSAGHTVACHFAEER